MYYIAADHVAWDYAPDGRNDITGEPFDDVAGVFTAPGPTGSGPPTSSPLYREYTDGSFTHLSRGRRRGSTWASSAR